MIISPSWIRHLVTWLEEMLSENYGGQYMVESLAVGTGFQESWEAIVTDGTGKTSRWFLRRTSSTARWCTISGIYSALGIPTIKPIPYDDQTLVYSMIPGVVLKDYDPKSKTELLQFADRLGEAFIPPLLTELGDRKPGNMILTKSLFGHGYCIIHIDFDKALYIPWYDKIINRDRFIKYLIRRLVLQWITRLDKNMRSVFIERFANSAEKTLSYLSNMTIRTPEDLAYNYLQKLLPSQKIKLVWDRHMLRFAHRQLVYWGRIGDKKIARHLMRLT
jgi:hypothetical protein